MAEIESIVAVRFDEQGDISYHVFGDDRVRLFIVDERCPHDRVFEWLPRAKIDTLRDLIPEGSTIGSSQDERHPAVKALIEAAMDGRSHLTAVPTGETHDRD